MERIYADQRSAKYTVDLLDAGLQAVKRAREAGMRVTKDAERIVPGFRVQAVETNGAEDVFHGACASGEVRGWAFERVLTLAGAVATMRCWPLGGPRGKMEGGLSPENQNGCPSSM